MNASLRRWLVHSVVASCILLLPGLLLADEFLLLKGEKITSHCLPAAVEIPDGGHVRAGALLLSCASVPYADDDVLIYDVTSNLCSILDDFSAVTAMNIHSVLLPGATTGGSLVQLTEASLQYDEFATLFFDSEPSELQSLGAIICERGEGGGPPPPTDVLAQLAYLKAHNFGIGDNFGAHVAVSGDTVVIGADREAGSATTVDGADDDLVPASGAAYVFVKDPDSGAWVQQAYLKASDGLRSDLFGSDVDIDGDTVVVGAHNKRAPYSSSGQAYVFVRNGGTWAEQAILLSSDPTSSARFGESVAISGDTIVVGTNDDKAFVFTRNPLGVWTEQQVLSGSNTAAGDYFGSSVDIDGETIVVGASQEDSNATGVDGDETNNSASASGATYVFTRSGEVWSQQAYLKASNTQAGDAFGTSVAVSGDTIAVGAFLEDSASGGVNGDQNNEDGWQNGAAYVFIRTNDTWSQQAYVKATYPDVKDEFGLAVSVSGDWLAVGSHWEDGNTVGGEDNNSMASSGAVYLYNRDGSTWSKTAYLKSTPNIGGSIQFGLDVRISGKTLISGAPYEDSGDPLQPPDFSTRDSGAAFVFNVSENVVEPGKDITPPVVTPPSDILNLEAAGTYTTVDLGVAIVTDDSGEILTATPDYTGPFILGDTTVIWSATDSTGNTGTAEQLVTIVDTVDPVISAPADISMVANGAFSLVSLGSPSATDTTGNLRSVRNDAPGLFPVGTTIVTWTAIDLSGNIATDTQTVSISPPAILVPETGALPVIDGNLTRGEWKDAIRFRLDNGFIAFMHEQDRLYLLIDMLKDDGDDPFSNRGLDQFWLYFDIDEDGVITPGVDLRYRLESGSGNLRLQTFCDGCPSGFNDLEAMTFSARGEGFGCFAEDRSANFLPLACNSHRVWELALDLVELGMRSDRSVRMGYEVSSGAPQQAENYPTDLNELEHYISLTLEQGVRSEAGAGPGPMNPNFEVTQAIQTPDNAVDLVAGKETAVRIWTESNGSLVKNFIYGSRNGVDLPGSPLLNVRSLYRDAFDKGRDSIVFNSFKILPALWSMGGLLDFGIVVRGLDDSTVTSQFASVDFVPTRVPVFWTVPLRSPFLNFPSIEPRGSDISNSEQRMKASVPAGKVTVVRRPAFEVNNMASSAAVIEQMKNYYQAITLGWNLGLAIQGVSPFDMPEQITGFNAHGFIDPEKGSTIAGSSNPLGLGGGGRVTWVSAPVGWNTYVHELNHNLDRASTWTWGRHIVGCGAERVDVSWPHGSDYSIQETGVISGISGGFQSVSEDTPDLMSYCRSGGDPSRWFSPYRWQAWVDEFRTDIAAEGQAGGVASGAPQPAIEESFYVLGRVYPDDSGEFTQVLRQPGIPDEEGITGDYSVSVLDCGDVMLAENSFPVTFTGTEGESLEFVSFSFVLPAPVLSCRIELTLNGAVMDSRDISAKTPTVSLITPIGGEEWSGTELVQWSADDLDGDDLLFTLLYSPDNGMSWHVIASMVDALEFEVDSTTLPGSDEALIRVLASDGGNTGHDDSDESFYVAEKDPVLEIISPTHGGKFNSSQSIHLVGTARNTLGEPWPEDSLLWSTTGGVIGTGPELSVRLEEGPHVIALIAMDGLAIAVVEVVEIVVSDDPGEISLVPDTYEVNEKDGQVSLRVIRTGAAPGPAVVRYSTVDGSAISGGDIAFGEDDYHGVSKISDQLLEWASGEAGERVISIGINEDDAAEDRESFGVLIEPLIGEALGTSSTQIYIWSDYMNTLFSDGFE